MPLQPNGRAPYTSASAAIIALDAYRDRGLGTPVDADVLTRAGVPNTIAKRTQNSLQELELLSEEGQPTQIWDAFRQARGQEEYHARLQEWLQDVYGDVLQYADPSTHSVERVQEAFRGYEPEGQRKAMASLLIGLWEYAGLPLAEQPSTPPTRRATSKPRQKSSSKKTARRKSGTKDDDLGDLSPSLVGLLREMQQLGGRWTSDQRNTFHRAFATLTDLTMQVVEDEEETTEVSDDQEVSA